MKQWLSEFKASWRDKNFVCAILTFVLAYVIIAGVGLLLSPQLYTAIISAIAGWQVASWSTRLAPKIKQRLFKE